VEKTRDSLVDIATDPDWIVSLAPMWDGMIVANKNKGTHEIQLRHHSIPPQSNRSE
jgi:hypothetical protein